MKFLTIQKLGIPLIQKINFLYIECIYKPRKYLYFGPLFLIIELVEFRFDIYASEINMDHCVVPVNNED